MWEEAQDANAKNDFIGAYAYAMKVPADSADSSKAKALVQQILPRVEKLQARYVQKADDAAALGFAAKAVEYYTSVLQNTPVSANDKPALEKKLHAASDQVAKLKKEYEEKLRSARDALVRGDALDAYRALTRASDIAEDQNFPWTFVEDQELELAKAELPANQRSSIQKHASMKKKRRATTAAPKEEEAIVGAVDTFASQEQEISRLKSVRDLVERARDYKKRGMTYEAVVTLEEARKKDPDSGAVKLLLEGLEEERVRLVEEYLEIADRNFAKQDLEAAVPYFRRVLRLESDNLRAKEAIQMFQNLEKIKQERSAAPAAK
jgi:hypothetical protein